MKVDSLTPATTPPASADVPEWLGVPIATLALVVAIGSFIIALSALLWQIFKHFLDGGRVRVYMNTAVFEPDRLIAVNRSGRFAFRPSNVAYEVTRGHALELAQLVVENPGKVPITIYSPGIHISGHGKKNHTVVPRMYATTDSFGPDSAIADRVFRLEPYGRVTFLLDYWRIVSDLLKDAPKGRVYLRGFVEVAGRSRRPQKSRRKTKWRIESGMYTSIQGSPKFTPKAVMWKEIYGNLPEREDDPERHPSAGRTLTRGMLGFVLDEAMSRFDKRPDFDAFREVLDEISKRYNSKFEMLGTDLYWAYEALDHMQGNMTEWTDGLLFRNPRNKPEDEETEQEAAADVADPDMKP